MEKTKYCKHGIIISCECEDCNNASPTPKEEKQERCDIRFCPCYLAEWNTKDGHTKKCCFAKVKKQPNKGDECKICSKWLVHQKMFIGGLCSCPCHKCCEKCKDIEFTGVGVAGFDDCKCHTPEDTKSSWDKDIKDLIKNKHLKEIKKIFDNASVEDFAKMLEIEFNKVEQSAIQKTKELILENLPPANMRYSNERLWCIKCGNNYIKKLKKRVNSLK